MYMYPGTGAVTSFTGNSGLSFSTVGQTPIEIPPGDVSSAFRNGWLNSLLNTQPGIQDVPTGAIVSVKLYQSAIPFIVSPTGTMGNNGAVTLGTALPTGFESGPCYLYLPAGAIATSSAAGWYYTVMSSTTVGVVYNNTYTSGLPFIPSTLALTAFATTGPGAYTGVTSAVAGPTFTIPANTFGPNGRIDFKYLLGFNASTNNKTFTLKLGASTVASLVEATTGVTAFMGECAVSNQGQTGAQVANSTLVQLGTSTTVNAFLALDTTAAVTVTANLTLATATDYIIVNSLTASVTAG